MLRRKSLKLYDHPDDFPFWIQINRHNTADLPDLHVHEFVEMVFVVEGSGEHLFQDIRYGIHEGDIFIINPGEAHGYSLKAGEELVVINCLFEMSLIPMTLLMELRAMWSMDFYYVQPFLDEKARFHHKLNLRGSDAAAVTAVLKDLMQELHQQREGYRLLIQIKMVQLFVLLSRFYQERHIFGDNLSTGEILVQRVCGYIERHANVKLSLTFLGSLFHISQRQLNRYFNRYVGCSPIEYIHKTRIEKAKRMLADTDETIAVISEAVGYEDASFFSKLFTRKTGFSPGNYRIKFRN